MTRLEEQRKKYGIPRVQYLPKAKVVIVFRLPNEEKTAGGLWIAETDQDPQSRGVLLEAGLTARDEMREHLIEIGDIVWFGKYAGWEHGTDREAFQKGRKVLQLKVDEINGSEEGMDRLYGKDKTHVIAYDDNPDSESYGQHFYEEIK